MKLLAFDLLDVQLEHLDDGIAVAPSFDRFSAAGKHVIRSIHAIPTLFDDVDRGEIEVYLGRAGATAEHVISRFRDHRKPPKRHTHGMVLFVGDTDDVVSWEGTANRVLKQLEERDRLCVRNAVAGAQGRKPDERDSCVYLTWRLKSDADVSVATRGDVVAVAREVAAHPSESLSAREIETAIDPLTRPIRDVANVDWHPAHEDLDDDE